jgi:hypothetical protein
MTQRYSIKREEKKTYIGPDLRIIVRSVLFEFIKKIQFFCLWKYSKYPNKSICIQRIAVTPTVHFLKGSFKNQVQKVDIRMWSDTTIIANKGKVCH